MNLIAHTVSRRTILGAFATTPMLLLPTVSEAALGERIPITPASGIAGDGTKDDSAAIMAFLAENKGKTIIFPQGKKFLLGNILMSGNSWNGTELIIEEGCELILSPKVDGAVTLQGAWAMFAFQACSDIRLKVRGWLNGNRANQPASQYIHLTMFAGVTDFDIPNFRVREYRGDGLYITSEKADGTGANSARGTIGSVAGYNSTADGRNLVSVISLTDSSFTSIQGVNVGGVINGTVMPGGFDIEPDNSNQLIENITVGSINVTGAGSAMVAIHGRPNSTNRCKGVTIGQSNVVSNRVPSFNDEYGNLTQNGSCTLKLRWCENVTILNHRGQHNVSYGNGVEVFCATRVKVRAQVSHVNTALVTGNNGYTVKTVADSDIWINAFDIARYGHSLAVIEGSRIGGRLAGPSSAYYSNRFGVIASRSLRDCVLSVSVVSNANWTRSYRHNGATYSNVVIADCDLSGSAWAGQTQQVGDMPVSRRNVIGVTGMPSIPIGGTWKAGDFVKSTAATTSTSKVLVGWKRLTNGNAQVLNTDWKAVWKTTVDQRD